jgi:hypothetical protein
MIIMMNINNKMGKRKKGIGKQEQRTIIIMHTDNKKALSQQ